MSSVCMLVWNEFLHDARVTKEAETLISLGWEVTVVGVSTIRAPIRQECLATGIKVQRVPREVGLFAGPLVALASKLGRLWGRVRRGAFYWHADGGQVGAAAAEPGILRRFIWLLEELAVNVRMVRVCRRMKPGVVHAHDANTLAPAWLAARLSGARLVYDAHELSTDREGYGGRVWLVRLVERWFGRAADARITTNRMRAEVLERDYGYPEMTILENRPRRTAMPDSGYLRDTFGIGPDHRVVIYQGGLQAGRGLHNLVRAIATTRGLSLVFVGRGPQEASLQHLTAELEATDRVFFHPMVSLEELPAVTASADIGVQTLRNTCLNHYTTDSNKLFEYIMAGLPVVASDFPEIRRIVQQHDVGLLVDPDDVGAISAALQRLRDDGELRARLASNARAAREACSWEAQEDRLISLYRALIGEVV